MDLSVLCIKVNVSLSFAVPTYSLFITDPVSN